MKKLCTSFLAMLVTCAAWSQTIPGVALQPVGSGFTAPTDLQNAGDERMFVVEKPGLIIAWNPGTGTKDTFLNITDRVLSAHMEQGLLGLAFDPDYANTGRFYVNYTALDSTGDSSGVSRISRFILSATDSNMADASSEEILLVQDQPFPNHNGGWIAFGPDGYLYFAIGDGGGAGDPQENAMNLGNLLGKVSRIDVSAASGYDIPGGNPFVGTAGAMPEIYHYGLRNPFRNSFDMLTGDLWIADVGQDMWEEINYVPAGTGGGLNFGWDCYEAFMPYEPTVDCPQDDSLTFPVYAYDHDPMTGDCSVAAGYVYRGSS
ncbi:MAG TPA: PQQ-dependent sugar dehydrogenase, partial [Chitinophagales bacterium]|nr:PQQ-dependent sugar dehydrogenase [Chitinophagales bacterium]